MHRAVQGQTVPEDGPLFSDVTSMLERDPALFLEKCAAPICSLLAHTARHTGLSVVHGAQVRQRPWGGPLPACSGAVDAVLSGVASRPMRALSHQCEQGELAYFEGLKHDYEVRRLP